ncbi:hypothetical protein RND71_003769 [Anisodus tanguticus]|uniref:Leucine-rich repeat-containing N-terminal plant-type domain-containing protein n=1 Tax=Anisodus tanguticus TaxID=243964 RepID=A0AAE1STW8_9SOLA|nr:hypothetical protein RND71_003769 [Anisodus tanguticus]
MKISLLLHLSFITILVVLLIGSNYISPTYGQCLGDQKALLIKFKNGLTFDSSLSTKLVRWDENTDCCLWPGVSCDEEGHVVVLELDHEAISGGIDNSSSLFDLQHLEKLNLAYNELVVPVPTEIYRLANLTYLNLAGAGQIPMELSRLTRLVILDLSSGIFKLASQDLKELVRNLANLRELYLDFVNISLKGSEWCSALSSSLPQLRVLSMIHCNISGPLDPVLFNLRFLSVIRLDFNDLSTTVPDFLANFTKLTTLSLTDCNLRGEFPSEIFQVPTLQELHLSLNQNLTGTVPEFLEKSALREVVLRWTSFTGSLPGSIANLSTLSQLDLGNCNFGGPIPSAMGNLTNLFFLDLSYNENLIGTLPEFPQKSALREIALTKTGFTGSLPDSIANLQKLTRLDLRSCNFSGRIPSKMGNLTDLVYLDLSYNSFTGSIPLFHKAKKLNRIDLSNNNGPLSSAQTQLAVFLSLPSLQFLSFQNSHLSGEVHEFSNASSSVLQTLVLSNNHLNGSIPQSIFKLRRLSYLSLSSNSFSGTINLRAIKGLPMLTTLDLSYNKLRIDVQGSNSTSFPFPQLEVLNLVACRLEKFPDLRNQSRMFYLDLSVNNIKGEIPNWVWRVGNGALIYQNLSCNLLESLEKPYNMSTSLQVIDLHSNRINGDPPILPTSLSYFSIANNKLTGSIPSSICNLHHLQFIDMSNNSIYNKIPPCLFQKADRLVVLNLGRNKLSGIIPDTFPLNCNLRTLDLNSNILEGKFPRSLQGCVFLEFLDIGNNKIRNTFPCMLKKLSNLHVLVLRSNMFHGNLYCPIANNQTWSKLQIIDLSANNFSGDIPPQYFSSWQGMMLSSSPDQVRAKNLQVQLQEGSKRQPTSDVLREFL